MPFSHDGFEDRVRRYPIPHMSAAETLGGTDNKYRQMTHEDGQVWG